MRKLFLMFLVCFFYYVDAQPGPHHVNININNFKPTPLEIKQINRPDHSTIYSFIIDSTSDFSKLKNLRSLTSINLLVKLKVLPEEIVLLSDSLKNMSISGTNNITAINQLKNLESLSISDFSVASLPDLHNLTKLKSLEVLGGKLKSVKEISNCMSLKELSLGYMDSLRSFDINSTNIESLSISNLENLKNINRISNCKFLKVLALSYLPIKNISGISSCNCLKELYLGDLYFLTELGHEISYTKLEKLDMERCISLKTINELANCSSLKSLNFFGLDSLRDFDFDMSRMNLESLGVFGCEQLNTISGLATCKSLKELSIGEGLKLLTSLDFDMSKMTLEKVFISGGSYYGNYLKNINGILTCLSLKVLELNGLDSLQRLDLKMSKMKLETLQVTNCKSLKSISGLSECKSLNEFFITDNIQLTQIPDLKKELSFVKAISILNNRNLKTPNISIEDASIGKNWWIDDNNGN